MPDLSEGSEFAGHRIEGVAGRGGMGTVYRATHLALDHLVALKVIAADLADDESFRARFKSETRIAVSLRHPNVVPIHHAGEEDGLLFVTMDLVEGPDLRKLLIARGALEPDPAVAILEQVAAALDVAHSRGLVHRDIKPGNILIDSDSGPDHAYLTDFGLTKRMGQASEATGLTSTGAFVGTLDYVAPEQIRGDELDARTDVYALGCVLHEMVTATPPYADREEKVAKMYAHLQDEPKPLEGPAKPLEPVIERAMAKERDDRFPSAGDLARAAAAALGGTRPLEAERSVATGPAAPTQVHETPVGETASPAETAEAPPPPSAPATGGEEPAAAAARTAAVGEPITREATATETAGREAGSKGPRSRTPLLAGLLLLVAAVAVGVVVFGGDDGEPANPGGGGGGAGDAGEVLEGGIDGGELPVGVAARGNQVFIADRKGEQVVLGEAAGQTRENAVATDGPPEELVFADESIWVTLPDAGRVQQFDAALQPGAPVELPGAEPRGIASGAGSVWVAGKADGTLTRIDPDSGQAQTEPLGANGPHGIAVSGPNVWVTAREDNQLLRVDRETLVVQEEIDVGANPKGVAVAQGVVWVANTEDGTLTLVEENTGDVIGEPIDVGGQPRAIDFAAGTVWVSNGDDGDKQMSEKNGWVDAFDPGSRERVGEPLMVGGSPEGLGSGGGLVWVATGPARDARAIKPR